MTEITFIQTASGAISIMLSGQILTVASDHRYYNEITQALKINDGEKIKRLYDLEKGIINYFPAGSDITVQDGVVYYQQTPVHNTVCERILHFMKLNLPVDPLVKFLCNLMQNPDPHSREQLYIFLENRLLPITQDGCFLAYKKVTKDWKDYRTQTFNYSIGQKPRVGREECDSDPHTECSHGLHVGTLDYVKDFHAGDGKITLVKVNPKDAISVPTADYTKMRVCGFEVLEEVCLETEGLSEPLYDTESGECVPYSPNMQLLVDDDWTDEDEEGWEEDEYEDEDDFEDDEDDEDDDWT